MKDKEVKGKQPSSRLLGMKFMQRSMEKEMQEELEKERKRIISEAEWSLDYDTTDSLKPSVRIDYQPSFLAFSTVSSLGRASFKEFNKEMESSIEDGVKAERLKREEAVESVSGMTDAQMGRQAATLRDPARKHKRKGKSDQPDKIKKRKRQEQETQGFMKPK
ncbi:hypothetical protein BDF14DRAFT_1822948 [Spinellus fusiger]|nr:hypothetical protein BDF14DRAFT_1822948 [Spinellus fusiger]